MLQAKYLQILLTVIIFLIGFASGRWSFNDVNTINESNVLAHTSSMATLTHSPEVSGSRQQLKKPSEANRLADYKNHTSTPKELIRAATTVTPTSCNRQCIQQQIDTLFEQGFGNIGEGVNTEEYSLSMSPDLTRHLEQDTALLAEFEGKLMEQIAAIPEHDGQNKEMILAMALQLPADNRAQFAWQMALSYQDPEISKLAFQLSPNDTQLHAHIANNAMQSVLFSGSLESLLLVEHVVNYGNDLSATTITNDLANLHNTSEDQFQSDLALSLLAQINPDSQTLRDTLTNSLDAEPQKAVSALRTMASLYRTQAILAKGRNQPASNLTPANRERIESMANDPAAPIDVRMASLQVLMSIDGTASQQTY